MSISPKLAALNVERYAAWKPPFTQDNARQALFAFKGDVYTGFDLESWCKRDYTHAQKSLRILSGLYGLLRPMDLMQAYRLEMGTKLETKQGSTLYDFWGNQLTEALNVAIKDSGSRVLVNLASNEYYGAVKPQSIDGQIVTPVFKDWKNGKLKIISFYAKKARGAMSDFIIRSRAKQADDLQRFDGLGYSWDADLSSETELVFTRPEG